jgi:hypothetical protein
LGEHQIPSHPHTHWEEKYQRSKQGLRMPRVFACTDAFLGNFLAFYPQDEHEASGRPAPVTIPA